jgi:hypothetical protein
MLPQHASTRFLCLAIIFLSLLAPVYVFGQEETKEQELMRLLPHLRSPNAERQKAAESFFVSRGKDFVPELIEILKTSKDQRLLDSVFETFQIIGKDAVPGLIIALKIETAKVPRDALALRRTLNALAFIAERSNIDCEMLNDELPALAEAVPPLINILESGKARSIATAEIFKTKQDLTADEISAITDHLQDFDAAAHCLGNIGRKAKDAVPLLIEILRNERYRKVGYNKLSSINLILTDLRRNADFSANESISKAFEEYRGELSEADRRQVERGIKILKDAEAEAKAKAAAAAAAAAKAAQSNPVRDLVNKYPSVLGIPVFILLLVFGWLLVFLFNPIWLLKIYEGFPTVETRLSRVWGTISFPLHLLTPLLVFHPRVLDAWVRKHLTKAHQRFSNRPTVKDRRVYVPVGLFLDGNLVPEFTASDLQETFARNQARLLISGVGGAGKTSLACQVAHWGMKEKPDERLCPKHLMIPVLLEPGSVKGGDDGLRKAICEQLSDAIGVATPISNALLEALLKKKRVLVLIDGLSEMKEETQNAILSGITSIPVNAVIFTSRNDETINDLNKTIIKPTKIKGNQLSSFVERYLTNLGRRELFEDEEFFEGCRLLSTIVNDREITALLATLFVEQMVAKQEKTIDEDLPENIPQLMLQSIKVLHAKTPSDGLALRDVIKTAKVIAWECLKEDYRPLSADFGVVRKSLADIPDGEKSLSHLKDKLKLIETTSFDEKIRFKIDPLAEYLAGMYLVEENKHDEDKWHLFFKSVLVKAGSSENIKGFLWAVRDCCLATGVNHHTPDFVVEELTKIMDDGLPPVAAS